MNSNIKYIPIDTIKSCIESYQNITTINSVVTMIRDKEVKAFYKIRPNNINIIESIFYKEVTGETLDVDNIDCAMLKDNLRFIYLPDKDIDSIFKTLKFSTQSKTDPNRVNYITTYIIGNISSDLDIIRLCCNIAKSRFDIFYDDKEFKYDEANNEDNLLKAAFFVEIYSSLFLILSRSIIGLDSGDFDNLYKALLSDFSIGILNTEHDEELYNIIKDIFDFSVFGKDSTDEDKEELILKVYHRYNFNSGW